MEKRRLIMLLCLAIMVCSVIGMTCTFLIMRNVGYINQTLYANNTGNLVEAIIAGIAIIVLAAAVSMIFLKMK